MKNKILALALAAMCFGSAVSANVMPATVIAADSDTEQTAKAMTLDDVKELAKKGGELTWSDFEAYSGRKCGTPFDMLAYIYEIDESYYLFVSGAVDGAPDKVQLCHYNEHISVDVLTGDVEAFIAEYTNYELPDIGYTFDEIYNMTEDEVRTVFNEKGLTDTEKYHIYPQRNGNTAVDNDSMTILLYPENYMLNLTDHELVSHVTDMNDRDKLFKDSDIVWDSEKVRKSLGLPKEYFNVEDVSSMGVTKSAPEGEDPDIRKCCQCSIRCKSEDKDKIADLRRAALNYIQLNPDFALVYHETSGGKNDTGETNENTNLRTFTVLDIYDTYVIVSVDGSRFFRELMFLYKKDIDSNIDPVPGMKLTLGYTGILETYPGQFTGVHDVKVVSENAGLIKGDSNCDGQVDMADVVFIMQALANPNRYGEKAEEYMGITALGKLNADMNGDGLTVGDALTIQRKLLGLDDENGFDASGIVTFEMEPTKTGVEKFLANNPKIANDYKEDELYNVTPSKITKKFGFTVFKFTKSCESYVVYKDKTYLLESSFGGPGTISFAAADLNKDGNYELYFTFSYGSGMNHAEVSCFDTSEDTEFYFCSDYFNDDMTLAVENGKLCVYKAAYKDSGSFVHIKTEPKEKIGEIVYEYGVIRFKRTDIAESDETKVKINTTIHEYGSEYVEMKADEAMVSSYDQASSALTGMGVWFKFESPKYPVTVSTENGKFRIYNYQGGGLGSINDVGKSYTVGRIGKVCFAPENVKLSDDYKAEVKITGEENGKTVDLGTLVITKTDKNTKGVLSVTFKKAGSASLAGKKFYYEKEGFGGYCNIEFNEDGTFLYSPGVLSSYLGGGTWKISGDTVILTEKNEGEGKTITNRFKIAGNDIVYIADGSDGLRYMEVKDGEKFSITAADT